MESDDQLLLTPPPPPAAGDAREAKRPRKRSRYLSPPYTDIDDGDVRAADVLAVLRAAALLDLDAPNAVQALRFLALYRRWISANDDPPSPSPPAVDGAPGSAALGSSDNKNPQSPPAAVAAAIIRNQDKNAAALEGADFAVNAASGVVAISAPPKRKKNNKNKNKAVPHFGSPAALVLDFAEGTPLPSKDQLLSTFHKFGSVIHSETAIAEDERRARVVFAARAEAEAAYKALGALGPPFATARIQDLPPITPSLPKLPLTDIRKNLEKMISSLTSSPQEAKPVGNLVGEMQGLLAKVDKMLQGASSAAHRQ